MIIFVSYLPVLRIRPWVWANCIHAPRRDIYHCNNLILHCLLLSIVCNLFQAFVRGIVTSGHAQFWLRFARNNRQHLAFHLRQTRPYNNRFSWWVTITVTITIFPGIGGAFLMYSGFCSLTLITAFFAMPETKVPYSLYSYEFKLDKS